MFGRVPPTADDDSIENEEEPLHTEENSFPSTAYSIDNDSIENEDEPLRPLHTEENSFPSTAYSIDNDSPI